ncbi:hypothetical protein [Trinickia mobilis]|nr:hypothetical protein [Trinickia mobilis]
MKNPLRRERPLLLAVASLLLSSGTAWADGAAADPSGADDSGLTI